MRVYVELVDQVDIRCWVLLQLATCMVRLLSVAVLGVGLHVAPHQWYSVLGHGIHICRCACMHTSIDDSVNITLPLNTITNLRQ